MPKVNVEHKSSVPLSEAMGKIKHFFENDQDIRRFDPKIKCHFPEGKTEGKVSGNQFKADISVSGDAKGTNILVIVDLPLILTPLKGKVEELIKKKLGKHLA